MYRAKHSVASSSGAAAIHLAVGPLGLNPDDEAIYEPVTDAAIIALMFCISEAIDKIRHPPACERTGS